MLQRKGQTILEYTIILMIILGVMLAMKDYVKRGIQGRWKTSADNVGDQYDPQTVNSNILYQTYVSANSVVTVENGVYAPPQGAAEEFGQWTNRVDTTDSIETKTGTSQVGS